MQALVNRAKLRNVSKSFSIAHFVRLQRKEAHGEISAPKHFYQERIGEKNQTFDSYNAIYSYYQPIFSNESDIKFLKVGTFDWKTIELKLFHLFQIFPDSLEAELEERVFLSPRIEGKEKNQKPYRPIRFEYCLYLSQAITYYANRRRQIYDAIARMEYAAQELKGEMCE